MENRGNIDKNGNVLYLDQERLDRKVMGFNPFHNKPNGIGMLNFFKEHVSARPGNWGVILKLFNLLVKCSKWLSEDSLRSTLYKRIMMFEPRDKRNSAGIVMPLNVDVAPTAEKVVVPMDLVKKALRETDFIGGMDSCICRNAANCKDYPHDLACLFLGDSGRTIVRHGVAKELTYEEAVARVERAASYGLPAQTLFVEIEQFIWGFPNDKVDHFTEICFCCPCCCVAMTLSRNAPEELRTRFHATGWTATVDEDLCVGCGSCLECRCPQYALKLNENGKMTVNQEVCIGCGICKMKCEKGAIKIKQTMPMRDDIHDYFLEEFNVDLKYAPKYR